MLVEEMRFDITLFDKKGEVKKEIKNLDVFEVERTLEKVDRNLYDGRVEYKNNVSNSKDKSPKLVKKIK